MAVKESERAIKLGAEASELLRSEPNYLSDYLQKVRLPVLIVMSINLNQN